MPHRKFWSRNLSTKAQREIAGVAAALGVDPRAVQILFNSFYDEDDTLMGWVEKLDVPAKDFAFAKAAGLMFDPIELDHDDLIAWVLKGRAKVKPLAVSKAFIASLGSRRFDARSALGSYAHVLHLARHRFEEGEDGCAHCDVQKTGNSIDLSSRNFRRLKWAGNVEQGDLEYVGCDLQLFAKLDPFSPSDDDLEAMRQLLDAIRRVPKTGNLTDLDKSLAGLFKSTKHERQVILEILGYAGILQPKAWPSLFAAWVPPTMREGPGRFRQEWSFPTSGWTGKDGINEEAVRFWFPQIV